MTNVEPGPVRPGEEPEPEAEAPEAEVQEEAEPISSANGDELAASWDEDNPTTVDQVLEWVGDDRERAAYALEQEGDDGRKTLVTQLNELIDGDGD